MNEASSRDLVPQAHVTSTGSTVSNAVTAPDATQNAAHDAAVAETARLQATGDTAPRVHHDVTHPAVTGTGTGDNRDETGDSAIGATVGGVGGAIVGALAGSIVGPAGAAAGAIAGALTGAGASGLAVDAVDRVDNDNTVSGVGEDTGIAPKRDDRNTDDYATIV